MTTPTAGGSAGGEAGGSQSTDTNPTGNGAGGDQGGQSRDDRRWSELTAKLDAKDAKIEELTGKLTDFETKAREATDATDTAKGELSKVVERLETDKKSLQSKLDEANGKIAGFETDAFERSILDDIQTEATAKAGLVRGAYREMLASRGLERRPKDAKDAKALAKERKKALAEDFPELFEQREQPRGGTPPGTQGQGGRGKRKRLTL